jgi:hypothetical protein
MDHDVAAWRAFRGISALPVFCVRIGDVQRTMIFAGRVSRVDRVRAFGSTVVALADFRTEWFASECNFVRIQDLIAASQLQCPVLLSHNDAVSRDKYDNTMILRLRHGPN